MQILFFLCILFLSLGRQVEFRQPEQDRWEQERQLAAKKKEHLNIENVDPENMLKLYKAA